MTLLMPEGNLRRKRKTFENFWLRALRGDNNDATNSELVLEKAVSANVSSWRSSRTLRHEDAVEPEEEASDEKAPPARRGRLPSDNQQQEQSRPPQGETPPPVVVRDGHTNEVASRPRPLRRVGLATPPTSQRLQQAAQPRYVTRVQGPTLGFVLSRIRENEGDVRELDFSNLSSRNKRLEPYGGVLVARVLTLNRTVTRLVLREHAIGDRGAVAIANMLRFNTTLEYIDLYGNEISDVGAEAIAKALYGHESLTHLNLWSNAISNTGARAFADALKCNRSLKYLGLVHNRITADGAQALLESLDVNTHLETLNLATNRIPHSITSQIRMALARNRVEAPRVVSTMKTAEADVKKRLEELSRRGEGADEDDDACSDASGFLSCSDTDTEEEGEEDEDGVWI